MYLKSWAAPTARPRSRCPEGAWFFEKTLGLDEREHPDEQERRVGEGHARERDVGAREREEGCCHPPRSAAESAIGQPRDGWNCERAGDDRDENRRQVARAEDEIRDSDQERETWRGVGDQRGIEVEDSVAREDPEAGGRVDAFVEVREPQAADGPEAQ